MAKEGIERIFLMEDCIVKNRDMTLWRQLFNSFVLKSQNMKIYNGKICTKIYQQK